MLNDFKLEIELEQQTPLIHFQHSEPGATLRASEVKPKLDRFLIKKLGGFDALWADEEKRKWLLRYSEKDYDDAAKKREDEKYKEDLGKTPALDYKIRITSNGVPFTTNTRGEVLTKKLKDKRNPLSEEAKKLANDFLNRSKYKYINSFKMPKAYFGNMTSAKDYEYVQAVIDTFKEAVFHENLIKINVICFNAELREKLKEIIQEFFILHNFGTRQSKGLGGFIVKRINGNSVNENLFEKIILENRFSFVCFSTDSIKKNSKHEYSVELLNRANLLYALMKSGINRSTDEIPAIFKGALREYFGKDSVFGDKHFIKSQSSYFFTDSNRKPSQNISAEGRYEFIRALLGVYDNLSFKDDERRGTVSAVSIENKEYEIARFPSPILIKILDNKIYFIADDELSKMIQGKKFIFLNEYDKKKYDNALRNNSEESFINSKREHIIAVPNGFSLSDFLFYFAYYYKKNKNKFENFAYQLSEDKYDSSKINSSNEFKSISNLSIKTSKEVTANV